GDTPLFRPMFFVWLSGLKATFGVNFAACQLLGIGLHALVCVLFYLLLQRIFSRERMVRDWRSPATWLPFALAFFYALNYSLIEQVIWFNIQPYLLFVTLVLAALHLLVQITEKQTRFSVQLGCMVGSWILTLIASFTYELGQFFAMAVGLYLA